MWFITYLNIFSNIVALLDFLYYFCKVKNNYFNNVSYTK